MMMFAPSCSTILRVASTATSGVASEPSITNSIGTPATSAPVTVSRVASPSSVPPYSSRASFTPCIEKSPRAAKGPSSVEMAPMVMGSIASAVLASSDESPSSLAELSLESSLDTSASSAEGSSMESSVSVPPSVSVAPAGASTGSVPALGVSAVLSSSPQDAASTTTAARAASIRHDRPAPRFRM